MNILFYIASALAIMATLMVIIRKNAVHALLYLIASLLSVSVIFFMLGAPFVAALEVIIYAGAIMVLFVFVIMMLNVGGKGQKQEVLKPKNWIGPSIITAILLGELVYMLASQNKQPMTLQAVSPAAVGQLMFSKYVLVVDLSAFLLLAGIIGAYHLGQKEKISHHRYLKNENLNA